MSLVEETTPSDLITQRNTARLINLSLKAKLGVSELPTKTQFKPLVLVGPSGAGKGTLINKLTTEHTNKFGFSVSYTTRPPREGEVDGKHYNFVTMEKFDQMIANDEFIEHCNVHGKKYGTAKAQIVKIQNAKQIPLLDIDVQGALKFEKVFPDSNFVAVLPPNIESLKERLVKRGTETEETLKTRLENAKEELETIISTKNIFTYRIVNDKLEVSQRVTSLLISGLYAEELTGKDTEKLVAETPRPIIPKSGSIVKKLAAVTVVGLLAAGAYLLIQKQRK